MRSKKEIIKEYNVKYGGHYTGIFYSSVLELLADIRDEQVSLNKTLSAVLAGLLVPAQQGTPDHTTDTR